MKVCRAIQIGLLTAVAAATWIGEQGRRSLAQAERSVSPAELAKVAPRKQTGVVDPFTTDFVTGPPQSTDFAIAQDIAATLASGQETGPHGEIALRVLPMVGDGGNGNILDVLTLAGADMTIVPVLLADRLRDARTFGDIRNKLVYIAPLFAEEFHFLGRPDVRTLADLAGKTVNLGEAGSAGAVLGREVLNHLGINIREVNLALDAALDGMRKGQVAATLLVSGKPINLLAHYASTHDVRFLAIPYDPALQNDYLPSTLGHDDYPNLIGPGESVDTIAIQSALFAYNWPMRSERFRLLELFVQTLFSRFSEFLGDAHHPKWRQVNLAAPVPGWQRFRPAERWLRRQSPGDAALRSDFEQFLKQNGMSDLPNREQLFQDFLRWRERNQGR